MHRNAEKRGLLLNALYDARESSPKNGWVFLKDLRALADDPEFALEILVELGHVTDGSVKYKITAKGALAAEEADMR